jgi:hypothetical protein
MNHQVNGLTTVSDLLATSLLEVPPFQRAYAWDRCLMYGIFSMI